MNSKSGCEIAVLLVVVAAASLLSLSARAGPLYKCYDAASTYTTYVEKPIKNQDCKLLGSESKMARNPGEDPTYKCVDPAGHVTFKNQRTQKDCTLVSLGKRELTQSRSNSTGPTSSRTVAQYRSKFRSRASLYSGCDTGHWIKSVSGDGTIVILEDNSVWEIDAVDAIDSALWLPTTDIVACDDKLINTEDGETVSAQQLR